MSRLWLLKDANDLAQSQPQSTRNGRRGHPLIAEDENVPAQLFGAHLPAARTVVVSGQLWLHVVLEPWRLYLGALGVVGLTTDGARSQGTSHVFSLPNPRSSPVAERHSN